MDFDAELMPVQCPFPEGRPARLRTFHFPAGSRNEEQPINLAAEILRDDGLNVLFELTCWIRKTQCDFDDRSLLWEKEVNRKCGIATQSLLTKVILEPRPRSLA
jgi:hypothetical protein